MKQSQPSRKNERLTPKKARRRWQISLKLAVAIGAVLVLGDLLRDHYNTRQPPIVTVTRPRVAVAALPKPTSNPRRTLKSLLAQQDIPNWARSRILRHVPVRTKDKVFALTFDDGPWPQYTDEVLEVLARYQVKATFFMLGREVHRRPSLARKVRDAGHAIGNHSWDHPKRPRNPGSQVARADNAIKAAVGFNPTLFRPPYGIVNNGMARESMQEKQSVILWSVDADDWMRRSSTKIANSIIRNATPGGIALLHDGGGDRSRTVAALPLVITTLRQRGYRFVTVPELLRLRHKNQPKPKATKGAKASKMKSATKAAQSKEGLKARNETLKTQAVSPPTPHDPLLKRMKNRQQNKSQIVSDGAKDSAATPALNQFKVPQEKPHDPHKSPLHNAPWQTVPRKLAE